MPHTNEMAPGETVSTSSNTAQGHKQLGLGATRQGAGGEHNTESLFSILS